MRARIEIGSSVLLRLPRLSLADTFDLVGRTWHAKREHHVTLLNRQATRNIGTSRIEGASTGVRFVVRFLDEFWIVIEGKAATLIRMCDVPQAGAFFRSVGAPVPPLHVTLYTSGTARGIGLASADDLHRLGRRLDRAEASLVLEQMRESRR